MVLMREWLSILDVGRVFDHGDEVLVLLGNLELHVLHSVDDILETMGEVVEDELAVRLDLLGGEGNAVDETHLLEDGRLARVTGAQEQDLGGIEHRGGGGMGHGE